MQAYCPERLSVIHLPSAVASECFISSLTTKSSALQRAASAWVGMLFRNRLAKAAASSWPTSLPNCTSARSRPRTPIRIRQYSPVTDCRMRSVISARLERRVNWARLSAFSRPSLRRSGERTCALPISHADQDQAVLARDRLPDALGHFRAVGEAGQLVEACRFFETVDALVQHSDLGQELRHRELM